MDFYLPNPGGGGSDGGGSGTGGGGNSGAGSGGLYNSDGTLPQRGKAVNPYAPGTADFANWYIVQGINPDGSTPAPPTIAPVVSTTAPVQRDPNALQGSTANPYAIHTTAQQPTAGTQNEEQAAHANDFKDSATMGTITKNYGLMAPPPAAEPSITTPPPGIEQGVAGAPDSIAPGGIKPTSVTPDDKFKFHFLGVDFRPPQHPSGITPVSAPQFSGASLGMSASPEAYKSPAASGLMSWQPTAAPVKTDYNTDYLKDYMKNKKPLNWQAYA